MTEDITETALSNVKPEVREILLDPAILHRYKKAFDELVTGEDTNKLLLFLIATTSYMDKVLGAIIMGESSAGKSHLMNSVLKFFPNVEDFTRITQASPDRMATDFHNKILKVEELHGAEKAQSSLRVLISEGKLKLLTTAPGDDGRIKTEVIETHGVPCFITSSTTVKPDEELLNRLFIISMDDSEKQTRKVVTYECREFMDPEFDLKTQPPQELKEALEHLALTPFKNVLIPYADQLAKGFPCKIVKARRDFKKLLYIISAVAFLHQYQRQIVHTEGIKIPQFIVALPTDFYMAWEIAGEGLKETLMNLQKRSLRILELFRQDSESNFTSRQVAQRTALSQTRAREILNSLVDFGYLLKDTSQKEHLFYLSDSTAKEGTTDDFVSSCSLFNRGSLDRWLTEKKLTTRRTVAWPESYVSPLAGEQALIPHPRASEKTEEKLDLDSLDEEGAKNGTESAIVSSNRQLTFQETIEKIQPSLTSSFPWERLLSQIAGLGCSPEEARKQAEFMKEKGIVEHDDVNMWHFMPRR